MMILDNAGQFKNKAAPGHASVIPAKAGIQWLRQVMPAGRA